MCAYIILHLSYRMGFDVSHGITAGPFTLFVVIVAVSHPRTSLDVLKIHRGYMHFKTVPPTTQIDTLPLNRHI